jgi:hypothetical protein
MALDSQEGAAGASFSHFLMDAAFAAPASALPFLSTAFASQPESAAIAVVAKNNEAIATTIRLRMLFTLQIEFINYFDNDGFATCCNYTVTQLHKKHN